MISRAHTCWLGIKGELLPLINNCMETLLDLAETNRAGPQGFDAKLLSRPISGLLANLRAHIGDFAEVRGGADSDAHARTYSDHGHQALLHIRRRKFGRLCLGLCSIEDVYAAMGLLLAKLAPSMVSWAYPKKTEADAQVTDEVRAKGDNG